MPRTSLDTSTFFPGQWHQSGALGSATFDTSARRVRAKRVTVNTPNFGKRTRSSIQRRDLPINPFTYSYREEKYGYGTWKETKLSIPTQFVQFSGHYDLDSITGQTPWLPTTDQRNFARNQAEQKVLERIKAQTVNLAQTFAERKQTADLIGSNATKIARAMIALRKGDLRGAALALGQSASPRKVRRFNTQYRVNPERSISRAFLELQYGWRPLLGEIYGSAEFLAARQSKELRRRESAKSGVPHNTSEDTAANAYSRRLIKYDAQLSVKVVIFFSTTGIALATAKEAGITNPTLLAWELLPYSFVADWFIPVGKFLSSLDATLGLTFEKGSATEFLDSRVATTQYAFGQVHTARFLVHSGNPPGSRYDINIKSSAVEISCIRTVYTTFPKAPWPTFTNPWSFEHAANAIALLRQSFKR